MAGCVHSYNPICIDRPVNFSLFEEVTALFSEFNQRLRTPEYAMDSRFTTR
jgi:hypothetical protein